MTHWVEVWPVAADDTGIWLVSGDEQWRASVPAMADEGTHWSAEMILSTHDSRQDVQLLHSTSWRDDGPRMIVTYVAIMYVTDLVRNKWPKALPIDPSLADAVGSPATHGPAEPPMPRDIDVLLHGLRHLRFLRDYDGTARVAMGEQWQRHLDAFEPALAGMYVKEHKVSQN